MAPGGNDSEQRRFERMRANLSIKVTPFEPGEEATLEKEDAFLPPQALKANTVETRDFSVLAGGGAAVSEDISLGGLKINTPQALPVGQRLRLEVILPEAPVPVSAIAEVCWSRPDGGQYGSGLKFIGISKSDLEKVERFIVLQKRAQFAKRG